MENKVQLIDLVFLNYFYFLKNLKIIFVLTFNSFIKTFLKKDRKLFF